MDSWTLFDLDYMFKYCKRISPVSTMVPIHLCKHSSKEYTNSCMILLGMSSTLCSGLLLCLWAVGLKVILAPCPVTRERVIASFSCLALTFTGFNSEAFLKFSNVQRESQDLTKLNPESVLDNAKADCYIQNVWVCLHYTGSLNQRNPNCLQEKYLFRWFISDFA